MQKYLAILVTDRIEEGKNYTVTPEMLEKAPEFDTREKANQYANLINSNDEALWIIMPVE